MGSRSNFYWLFVFLNFSIFIPSRSEPTCIEGKRAKKLNDRFAREHNEFRIRHGLPSLEIDPKLIKDATNWSYHMAKKGALERSRGREGIGENLAKWFTFDGEKFLPIQAWYNETDKYRGGDFRPETVWNTTRKLGCGVCSDSEGKNQYITCRYFPSGNHSEQFKENVLATESKSNRRKYRKGASISKKKPANKERNVAPTSTPRQDSYTMKTMLYATTIFLLILSTLPFVVMFTIIYRNF